MRALMLTLAASAVLGSAVAAAPLAQAGQTTHDVGVISPAPAPDPTVQLLDCAGTTGSMGCGPGWFWRDGWRGIGCYPC